MVFNYNSILQVFCLPFSIWFETNVYQKEGIICSKRNLFSSKEQLLKYIWNRLFHTQTQVVKDSTTELQITLKYSFNVAISAFQLTNKILIIFEWFVETPRGLENILLYLPTNSQQTSLRRPWLHNHKAEYACAIWGNLFLKLTQNKGYGVFLADWRCQIC